MTKAIDRKKKVEMLEKKYRDQREEPDEEDLPLPAPGSEPEDEESPATEARLKEEMDDFFQSGQSAGAQLFNKVSDLSGEKVDEIKDALEDVFDKEVATPNPEQVTDDTTFVNFFKEVQGQFDEPPGPGEAAAPVVEERPVPPAPVPRAEPPPEAGDLEATAVEVSTPEPVAEQTSGGLGDSRLNLLEILLTEDEDEAETQRRIEVLCRIVARLVERVNLPESEIIEALIKSGVEF
ncbi:MAG: hypothetical protein ACYTFD_08915 [Planctomycetota bacterium]|jgi:hypothetical protein